MEGFKEYSVMEKAAATNSKGKPCYVFREKIITAELVADEELAEKEAKRGNKCSAHRRK